MKGISDLTRIIEEARFLLAREARRVEAEGLRALDDLVVAVDAHVARGDLQAPEQQVERVGAVALRGEGVERGCGTLGAGGRQAGSGGTAVPAPPLELVSVRTSTAAMSPARLPSRRRMTHSRAVANADGAFF